jgi:hypothetical protein
MTDDNNEKGGKNEMDKFQKKEVKTYYRDTCRICGKEIIGTSESQVNFNMNIHVISSHPTENNELKN